MASSHTIFFFPAFIAVQELFLEIAQLPSPLSLKKLNVRPSLRLWHNDTPLLGSSRNLVSHH